MGQCPRQGRTCLFSAPPGTLPPLPLLVLLKPSCLLQVSINHTLTHSDQQSLEIDNYLDSSILDSSFPTFPGLRAEVSCFVPASRAGVSVGSPAPPQLHPSPSVPGLRHSCHRTALVVGRATAFCLCIAAVLAGQQCHIPEVPPLPPQAFSEQTKTDLFLEDSKR